MANTITTSRISWLLAEVERGRQAVIRLSFNEATMTDKVSVQLGPRTAKGRSVFTDAALQLLQSACASHAVADRGHRHSDGRSAATFYVRPYPATHGPKPSSQQVAASPPERSAPLGHAPCTEVQALRDANTRLEADVKALRHELSQAQGEVRLEFDRHLMMKGLLQSKLDQAALVNEDLRQHLFAAQSETAGLKEFEDADKELRAANLRLESEVTTLRHELSRAQEVVRVERAAVTRLCDEADALQDELKACQDELSAVRSQQAGSQYELSLVRSRHDVLQDELSAVRSQQAEDSQCRERLQSEYEELHRLCCETKKEMLKHAALIPVVKAAMLIEAHLRLRRNEAIHADIKNNTVTASADNFSDNIPTSRGSPSTGPTRASARAPLPRDRRGVT